MADRVYLHVGPPKTGTTYIQQILWRNLDLLAQLGVSLPTTRRGQFLAAASLCDPTWKNEPDAAAWTWDRLAAEARAARGVAVVSEEMLAGASPEDAGRAVDSFAPAEVHVVATVRDLGRQIPSMWQQALKQRDARPLDEYVRWLASSDDAYFWRRQDVPSVLKRWLRHIPAENVHILTVPPPGGPDPVLWERFCAVLAVDHTVCDTTAVSRNPSLRSVQAEVLRRFNEGLGERLPSPQPYVDIVRRHVVPAIARAEPTGSKFGLSDEWATWLNDRSLRMVEDLQLLECNLVGEWDDLLPRLASTDHYPLVPPAEDLETVAVEAMTGLAVRMAAQHKKLVAAEATVTRQQAMLDKMGATEAVDL